MKAPDLPALLAHYQRELRLLDWRVSVSYAPDLADAQGRPVWGLCYPVADNKTARIVIRDPATPPPGASIATAASTVEETIVHELLHLHFAAFGNVTPAAVAAEENAVWALSGALVAARGTPREGTIARAMLAGVDRAAHTLSPENLARLRTAYGLAPSATAADVRAALATATKHGLSPREVAMCAEMKVDPAKYTATRDGIRARRAR